MAIRSRDFVGIAEGIKSHELSTKGKIEQLKGRISELSGRKSSINGTISYLEAAIAAAYEDTDEDGDPDYGLIASLEAEKGSAENELSGVEQDLDSTGGELEQSENELESVLEEKAQTLFEIQERARTTSKNIALAGGMYGAYSGVGGALQSSMQTSLSALSQAASILGGSVDGNGSAGSGNTTSGAGNSASGAGVKAQGDLSASPLAAFAGGKAGAGVTTTTPSATQFYSSQMDRSTPATLPNFHSGQATINVQKPQNFISEQATNAYITSSLSEKSDDSYQSANGLNFQSGQESPGLEDSIRPDLEKRRKWAEQYKVNVSSKTDTSSSGSNNSGSPSRGQREKQLAQETELEFDGIGIDGLIRNAAFRATKEVSSYALARKDIDHFHKNEMLYSYDDMSNNPQLSFVDPRSIFGLNIGDKKAFWNYKGSESKDRYMELVNEINTVKLFHNIKNMSYEQIAQLGGTLGACAQYYFLDNAIRVEKVGNAYIFQGDGRHRLQAAIEAGIDKVPIMIVGEHSIKPRINGIKQGNRMSFAQADSGNVNPKYGIDIGYSKNCQSCVVVFEARLRGYNVRVLPNKKGSVLETLSRNCNWAWIDPKTGKSPDYIFDSSLSTADEYLNFVRDKVVQENRYTIQFAWRGRGNCGHIVNLDRTEDGKLRIKDNQRGVGERSEWVGDAEVLEYLSKMKYYDYNLLGNKYSCVPKLLRIDNMDFNPDVVDYIMEGRDDE
ncbi:toxin glutamine deamidase domain-containing protein [Agathobacter rectalis]|uniref:toxin glutamine deamidase domain-containing protein n=1 Tax=Agathobacter rectalis TaxID=39491 RepID=UPI0032C06B14